MNNADGYHVELGLSGFRSSPPPVNGRRLKFCTECGGFLAVDHNGLDLYCPVCGLIDEEQFMVGYVDNEQWTPQNTKLSAYQKRIEKIQERIDPRDEESAPHLSEKRKKFEAVMIDRRVEIIIRSLHNPDTVTDLGLTHGVYRCIMRKYNEQYSPEVTYDAIRNSYTRVVERLNNKIDELIRKVIHYTCYHRKALDARSLEYSVGQEITPKLFPACFLHEGTTVIGKELDPLNVMHFHARALTYRRKKEVAEFVRNRPSPIELSRTYESNGQPKKIRFMFMFNRIHLAGDDSATNFEDFFLVEALKLLSNCPGTQKRCPQHEADFVAFFRKEFRRLRMFIADPFYDATPYLPHPVDPAQ